MSHTSDRSRAPDYSGDSPIRTVTIVVGLAVLLILGIVLIVQGTM